MSDSLSFVSNTQNSSTKKWYASWFDTPYYHILYKERDNQEAEFFIDNITNYLNLPDDVKVLDLACGKGRHALYLNKLGYNVTGADLSENSINCSKKDENLTLKFVVHDMRNEFEDKFHAIFNLFTSFGYFENDNDNLTTLKAIKNSLTDDGFAVIDFMNVNEVIKNLIPNEVKSVDGINFHIKRYVSENHIFKEIDFEADGQKFHFTEKVKALTLNDFEEMMAQAGIYLLDIFGDYKLHKFHKTESERLIMVFK
jgi:SAM-dependent methyltransferase